MFALPRLFKTVLWFFLVFGCCVGDITSAQTNAADNASQLLQAPTPGSAPSENRVFSSPKIFQKPIAPPVSYDLKERPAPGSNPALFSSPSSKPNTPASTTGDAAVLGAASPNALTYGATDPNAAPQRYTFGFADWIQSSVGMPLPLFGSDWFDNSDKANAALDPLTVPADYRIGPGDELLVRAWGQIDVDFQGVIDRSGQIFLPKIGQVTVAGQRLGDVRELLATTISRQYKKYELTVTLGALRQIQYYVAGFVRKPGIHSTASTATLMHGLLVSGGPLSNGDLRHMELRRGGRTVAVVDAYQFLANGDKSADPQLLPGDVIFVPAAQGLMAVAGSVRRPGIYHLKEPSTVGDALALAGGLNFSQAAASARLERLVQGKRQVQNLVLDAATQALPLQDGDLLLVLPPAPQFDAVVTLRGNVAQPLKNPWRPGMRVSDLVQDPEALVRFGTWMKQNSRSAFSRMADMGRDSDFQRDFPDVDWSYATIERIDARTLSNQLLTFHLGRALQKDPEHDLLLASGDTVVVFTKSDFRQPQANKLRLMKIEGEVHAPGIYPAEPGDTLASMVKKAGGLTPQAYMFGAVLSRESARKDEGQRLREVADRMEQDYLRYLSGRSKNSLAQEEPTINNGELEVVKALVTRLRNTPPEGRIALNLHNAQAQLADLPPLTVEDMDSLVVPAKPATVTVVGAVFRQGSLLWNPNWGVHSYLDNSGGLQPQANRAGIVVYRADGTVRQPSGWLGGDALNPGDTVVVPEDVSTVSWSRVFRDWSQIFYQLALGGAALKVLRSTP